MLKHSTSVLRPMQDRHILVHVRESDSEKFDLGYRKERVQV